MLVVMAEDSYFRRHFLDFAQNLRIFRINYAMLCHVCAELLPPGRGTCGPRLGFGSTRQFDVFLAYKSKSGSNIVSLCIILDGSRGLPDN